MNLLKIAILCMAAFAFSAFSFADEVADETEAFFTKLEQKSAETGGAVITGIDKISTDLETTGVASVIVTLRQPEKCKKMTAAEWDSPASLEALHLETESVSKRVMSRLANKGVKQRVVYENWAGFSCDVTKEGLSELAADPDVLTIEENITCYPKTRQGLALLQATTVQASSYKGSGISIAICDTGVDYKHPQLGGGAFPNSKVIGGYNFGDSMSDPHPDAGGYSGSSHGTSCASIAAGLVPTSAYTTAAGDFIGGVAPDAKIYALKISGSDGFATDDVIWKSFDWCVSHKNDNANNPILIISISFGGGMYSTAVDSIYPAGVASVKAAKNAGITIFACSHNGGYCNAICAPAALSEVIAVGAVYDANIGRTGFSLEPESCLISPYYEYTSAGKPCCYSNSSPTLLDLYAPAHDATCCDKVYTSAISSWNYISYFGGTSAATPYAAGCAVLLQQRAKQSLGRYLTKDEVKSILTSTGTIIEDSTKTPKVSKPFINLNAAFAKLPVSVGAVTVSIGDSAAVTAGAAWSIDSGKTWRSSGTSAQVTPGNYTVTFKSISNYLPPEERNMTVTANKTTTLSVNYCPVGKLDLQMAAGDFSKGVTSSIAPGNSLDFSWTVKSNYTFANKFWCEIFASKTGGFDLARFGGTVTNSYTKEGALETTVIKPSNLLVNTIPNGRYTLVPCVNRGNISGRLSETNFLNNWEAIPGKRLDVYNPVATNVDLQLRDLKVSYDPRTPNKVTFTGKMYNGGAAAMPSTGAWVEVFYGTLTPEGILMPQGTLCAGQKITSLASGASANFTQSGNITGGAMKKAFAVIVDSTDIVAETNETNNSQLLYDNSILPAGKTNGIDLAITDMGVNADYLAPNSIAPNSQMQYAVVIQNKGKTMPTGKVYLELFASQDGGVSTMSGSTLLWSEQITPPAIGKSQLYQPTKTVNSIGDGMYALTAVVNRIGAGTNPGDVTPLDNKRTLTAQRVYLKTPSSSSKMNLTWTNGPVFTKGTGNKWTVAGTIKNTGTTRTPGFWTEVFIGTKQANTGFFYKDSGTVFAAGDNTKDGLAAGASKVISITGTCPTGKILGVLTDSTDVVAETDETDNYNYSSLTK